MAELRPPDRLPPGLYSLACSLEDHDDCPDDGVICSCTCHWVAKAIRGE